jgi:transposase
MKVMDQDKKGYIRYLFRQENLSVSEIARRLSISRKTVRGALIDEGPKKRRKRPSKLDPFKEGIKRLLTENPNITNVLILEKIHTLGYNGGKSILGEYLLEIRKIKQNAFLNIETLPGIEAQVDWASCGSISCGEHKRKLYLFCMVLSYSRYMYISFTTSMDMNTFMACHIKAFRFFGGTPRSLLYDNLKSVVNFRYGKQITFNARFLDFANYHAFKIKTCNVRKGNEKGKVERAIRYVKNNFLNRESYENFEQIKLKAGLWLRNTANNRIHSVTRKKPGEMFLEEEKAFLLSLPENDYDYPQPQPLHIRKDCLFHFESNRYSVPADYINKPLFLKPYINEIKVVFKDEVIATFKRCYDKYQTIKNPEHYASLIEKKKKAASHLQIERFKELCPEAKDYFEGLIQNQINVIYHVNQILSLEKIFGKTAVCGAINHALAFKAFHWEFIKNILFNSQKTETRPQTMIPNKEDLMNMKIKPVDLSQYDRLSKKRGNKNGR